MQNHSVIKSFTNDRAGAQQIEGEMPALELHHQGLAMPDQCMRGALAVSKVVTPYRVTPACRVAQSCQYKRTVKWL